MTLHRSSPSLRLAIAALVGCLLLAGCASEDSDEHDPGLQPAPEESVSPTPDPTPAPGASPTARVGDVDFTELAAFRQTQLRMEQGTVTPLGSEEAVRAWLPADAPARLVRQVDEAAALVGDGVRPYGVVLAMGCDAPRGYTLERVDGELAVAVEKSLTSTQCLAPMTWLAVVGLGVGD